MYDWNFAVVWPYLPALGRGLLTTIQLTVVTIGLGTPIGVLVGVALTSRSPLARWPILACVDVLRSLPILILILWVYYVIPQLVGRPRMSSFTLASIALVANLAAFVADVVRASIRGFPTGLREAALASGLSNRKAMLHVVLPGVVRELLPTMSLLYIDMLKLTSLASVIAVTELLHTADLIRAQTFRALEVFTVVAVAYLLLVMPFSAAVRALEHSSTFGRRS